MSDELATIDLDVLDQVTGGRYTQGPDRLKPELVQMIGKLAEAVQGIGQAKVNNDQQKFAQLMQVLQKMMEMRGGK
jgi:hypothetical protein